MKLGIRGHLTDVITCVKFLVDRFRGYGVMTTPKLPFPIDLLRRPYNSVALPCDTVIYLFIYFFSDQRREETPGRILTRNGSEDAESCRDVRFWGYKMKI